MFEAGQPSVRERWAIGPLTENDAYYALTLVINDKLGKLNYRKPPIRESSVVSIL